MAETLCQKRALEAFRLDPAKWGGKCIMICASEMKLLSLNIHHLVHLSSLRACVFIFLLQAQSLTGKHMHSNHINSIFLASCKMTCIMKSDFIKSGILPYFLQSMCSHYLDPLPTFKFILHC